MTTTPQPITQARAADITVLVPAQIEIMEVLTGLPGVPGPAGAAGAPGAEGPAGEPGEPGEPGTSGSPTVSGIYSWLAPPVTPGAGEMVGDEISRGGTEIEITQIDISGKSFAFMAMAPGDHFLIRDNTGGLHELVVVERSEDEGVVSVSYSTLTTTGTPVIGKTVEVTALGASLTDEGVLVPGPQGEQGEPGPPGARGPAGSAGEQGPQGLQGVAGPQGEQGVQGEQGIQGDQGPAGTGEPGDQGVQGEQGPIGPTGPQGRDGEQGVQGLQGPAGVDGVQGPAGPQGQPGVAGPTGATGPAGPQGTQGVAGPQGATGAAGATGQAGVTGPTGPQGAPAPTYAANCPALAKGDTWTVVHNLGSADVVAQLRTVATGLNLVNGIDYNLTVVSATTVSVLAKATPLAAGSTRVVVKA